MKCVKCLLLGKRSPIVTFQCKCELNVCINHRHPDTHECTFDWKANGREKLQNELKSVKPQKVLKI